MACFARASRRRMHGFAMAAAASAAGAAAAAEAGTLGAIPRSQHVPTSCTAAAGTTAGRPDLHPWPLQQPGDQGGAGPPAAGCLGCCLARRGGGIVCLRGISGSRWLQSPPLLHYFFRLLRHPAPPFWCQLASCPGGCACLPGSSSPPHTPTHRPFPQVPLVPLLPQVRLTFKAELQQLWVGSAVSTQVRQDSACRNVPETRCCLSACTGPAGGGWCAGHRPPGSARLRSRQALAHWRAAPGCTPLPLPCPPRCGAHGLPARPPPLLSSLQKVPYNTIAKMESQAIKGQEEYSSACAGAPAAAAAPACLAAACLVAARRLPGSPRPRCMQALASGSGPALPLPLPLPPTAPCLCCPVALPLCLSLSFWTACLSLLPTCLSFLPPFHLPQSCASRWAAPPPPTSGSTTCPAKRLAA